MFVPTDIRLQIALLMTEFESHIVVKRKMQVEFDIQTPGVYCIIDVF